MRAMLLNKIAKKEKEYVLKIEKLRNMIGFIKLKFSI